MMPHNLAAPTSPLRVFHAQNSKLNTHNSKLPSRRKNLLQLVRDRRRDLIPRALTRRLVRTPAPERRRVPESLGAALVTERCTTICEQRVFALVRSGLVDQRT